MVDAMRSMLDELMGKERDVPLEKRSGKGLRYHDPEICKYALAGLCPYGLFKNTKSDLGVCQYEIHEDDLQFEEIRAEYDKLTQKEKDKAGYEQELLVLLTKLVRDMDRKIERQKERAQRESEPRPVGASEQTQLDAIKEKEKEALEKSEKLAEEGDVDGSILFANQAEGFKQQWEQMHTTFTQPERTMTVCDICGVFINSTDNEQRRKDHLMGKQYLGWKAIREKLEEVKKAEANKLERPRDRERGDRERGNHHRSSERERERERDRDRGRSSRSDRDRDRDRERTKDRGRRERERSPRRRTRSPVRRHAEVPPPGSLYKEGGSRHAVRERDQEFDEHSRHRR